MSGRPSLVPPAPLTGRILGGRYRVGALLGAGAMGRVYRAQHVELGRPCAVKVIRPPEGGDDDDPDAARVRFRIEALAAARLDHPNVLRVLDFGREPEDDLHYLVTEQLEGADLADVLAAEGPLSAARLARIGRGICAALQHAHDRGVIHRDLKPENVLLVRREGDDGQPHEEVKILDFGTALIEGEDPEAADGVVLGTPAYMSPEQSSGAAVDARSDVYALGVLLFELATGRLPFDRSTPAALAAAHAHTPPPRPSAIVPGVDPELERIILACLRKPPRERPRDAREVREALGAVLARLDGGAAEPEPDAVRSGPRSRWPMMQRMARWAAALAGGAGVAALLWSAPPDDAARAPEPVTAPVETRRPREAPIAASPASFRPDEASAIRRDAGADGGEGALLP